MRIKLSKSKAARRFNFPAALLMVLLSAGCAYSAEPLSPKAAVRKYESDYRTAVELYQSLIRKGQGTDSLHFELGMLYLSRADFKLAIEEFKNSSNVQAGKMSAIAYYSLGDYVEALKILDEQKSLDDQGLYYYGLICEKLNLFDKALESYRRIKPGEFSAKAIIREGLIEKAATGKRIQEVDPEISRIISGAPSAENYPQAGAQVLLCDEKVQVTADNKEISSLHYVVKILNERGKEGFSETQIDYDSTYEKVELDFARTIKPDGTVVDVGSRHIRDVSKYMNFPLYSNARVFIISFPEIAEGAAVEYKVKIFRNQLVNKKDFVMDYPVQSSEPIIQANFTLEIPRGRVLSIKTINDGYNYFGADLKPEREELADKTVYSWIFHDIPQIVPENGMPPAVEINPTIIISTFQSWQDIYNWWWALAKDKISPDGAIKDKVRELVSGVRNDEEKLRAIYNFCAKDIRYVAVEYGQAGYEPHMAGDIFRNKYGDCKDQAVLLATMLNSAGFPARLVLIGTRDNYNLDENFPNMLFNHAIAAVNFEGRAIFLDATAETCSFGDLPPADQQRKVFTCSQDGYKIENTPLFPAAHNLVRQEADIKIDDDESITAERSVFSFGVYDQSQRGWLLYTMPDVVKEQLATKAQDFSIGSRIESYRVKNINDLNKPVELSYKFRGPEYLIPGGSLRIMPQVSELDKSIVAKDSRRYPIEFSFLDIKELELNLLLPANFVIKYIPEKVSRDSPWMHFEAAYSSEGRKLVFKQKSELKKNKITESEYPAFKAFFEGLAKSLKQRVVLERKR